MPQEVPAALSAFVRTPGLGPCKTRLAAGWGEARTAEFYRFCLGCIAELMKASAGSGWEAEWAVAEKDGLDAPAWSGFRTVWQGDGGLGSRMARILNASLLRSPRAVLIGSDAPQIRFAYLEAARRALDHNDIMLGPAADGGFWLIAARMPIPEGVLEAITYSREDTRQRLVLALQAWWPGIRISEALPVLRDADIPSDVDGLGEELGENGAQGELRAWLIGRRGRQHG